MSIAKRKVICLKVWLNIDGGVVVWLPMLRNWIGIVIGFLSVTSFWGNNVFGFMRETMQSLIQEGGLKGRGLTHFQGRDKEWYNALVWSDANKATTREQVRPREPGFWWPAIAIIMVGDRVVLTYCQDFALQRSKEAWMAHPSRVHRLTPPGPPPGPPPMLHLAGPPPGQPMQFQMGPPPGPPVGPPPQQPTWATHSSVTIQSADNSSMSSDDSSMIHDSWVVYEKQEEENKRKKTNNRWQRHRRA